MKKFSGPTAKTISERLPLPATDAKVIKAMMDGKVSAFDVADALGGVNVTARTTYDLINTILKVANKVMGGYGVEYLRSSDEDPYSASGIEYVNMGDTYYSTLMYDWDKKKFIAGSWGDQVEAQPRRFSE